MVDKNDLESIEAAAASGVRAAFADQKTWEAGFAALRTHLREAAQAESGRWVIGWVGWLVRRAVLWLAVLAVLWYTGGLPAVLAWIKAR